MPVEIASAFAVGAFTKLSKNCAAYDTTQGQYAVVSSTEEEGAAHVGNFLIYHDKDDAERAAALFAGAPTDAEAAGERENARSA